MHNMEASVQTLLEHITLSSGVWSFNSMVRQFVFCWVLTPPCFSHCHIRKLLLGTPQCTYRGTPFDLLARRGESVRSRSLSHSFMCNYDNQYHPYIINTFVVPLLFIVFSILHCSVRWSLEQTYIIARSR